MRILIFDLVVALPLDPLGEGRRWWHWPCCRHFWTVTDAVHCRDRIGSRSQPGSPAAAIKLWSGEAWVRRRSVVQTAKRCQ